MTKHADQTPPLKNAVLAALLTMTFIALAACGGGGDDQPSGGTGSSGGTPPPPPPAPAPVVAKPEGIYNGVYTVEGRTAEEVRALISADGKLYIVTGNNMQVPGASQGVQAFIPRLGAYGQLQLAGGKVTNTDGRIYSGARSSLPATFTGTYTEGTVNLSLRSTTSGTLVLSRAPAATEPYLGNLDLGRIAGNYQGRTLSETATFSISGTGAISGSLAGGCTFNGTIAQTATGKTPFTARLTYGPSANCPTPNAVFTGPGIVINSGNDVGLIVENADRSVAQVLLGREVVPPPPPPPAPPPPPPPPPSPVAAPVRPGVYFGTVADGGQGYAIVSNDRELVLSASEFMSMNLATERNYFATGSFNANSSAFTAVDGLYLTRANANFANASVMVDTAAPAGVVVTVSPSRPFNVNFVTEAPITFRGVPLATTRYDFSRTPLIADATGTWSAPFPNTVYNFTIAGSGAITGNAGTCPFTGTLTPKPVGNLFSIAIRYGSTATAGCETFSLAGSTYSGLAFVTRPTSTTRDLNISFADRAAGNSLVFTVSR